MGGRKEFSFEVLLRGRGGHTLEGRGRDKTKKKKKKEKKNTKKKKKKKKNKKEKNKKVSVKRRFYRRFTQKAGKARRKG